MEFIFDGSFMCSADFQCSLYAISSVDIEAKKFKKTSEVYLLLNSIIKSELKSLVK